MMGHDVDLTGLRFGRLSVIGRAGKNKYGKSLWLCRCDCGNTTKVMVSNLTCGITKSCGCLHKETFNATTHGASKTRLYRIWRAMKERCGRPGAINYKYYGAKGIRVSPEWNNSFEAFSKWATENGYEETLTIDRVDSSKDYSPSNCRWITREENASRASKEMQRRRKEASVC